MIYIFMNIGVDLELNTFTYMSLDKTTNCFLFFFHFFER